MNTSFWNEKKVLVTGGSGFIGRWLCRTLSAARARIHVTDLVPPRGLEFDVEFQCQDLRDLETTKAMLKRIAPETIIHLAGQAGVTASYNDPVGTYEANVLATFNVLEASRQVGGMNSVVAVSSNHVYGDQVARPTTEDSPLNGLATYAVTKLCGDVLARTYGKIYRLPVAVARLTNSYGGDDEHVTHIVTGTILSALRGATPIINRSGRDRKGYLYVKDTVMGLLAIAEGVVDNPRVFGEAFNIVPNETVSVREIVHCILKALGNQNDPLIRQPDAVFEVEHLDNGSARKYLGWSPQYSLQLGLAETIAWFRKNGPRPSDFVSTGEF